MCNGCVTGHERVPGDLFLFWDGGLLEGVRLKLKYKE